MRQSFFIVAIIAALISCAITAGLLVAALAFGGGTEIATQNATVLTLAGIASIIPGVFVTYLLQRKMFGKAFDSLEKTMLSLARGNCAGQPEPMEGFYYDVKKLSEALRTLHIACKGNYERLQGILGGIYVPFLLVDTDEKVIFTNNLLLNMLEIDGVKEKQYGRTLAEVFYNEPGR